MVKVNNKKPERYHSLFIENIYWAHADESTF